MSNGIKIVLTGPDAEKLMQDEAVVKWLDEVSEKTHKEIQRMACNLAVFGTSHPYIGEWCVVSDRPCEDCSFCNNEACNLCGAGLSGTSDTDCQHDVCERHEGVVSDRMTATEVRQRSLDFRAHELSTSPPNPYSRHIETANEGLRQLGFRLRNRPPQGGIDG
jgi:hypothetical protein